MKNIDLSKLYSAPVIIKITNSSDAVVDNVELFDALRILFSNSNYWTENGNYRIGNITISSVIQNVSYRDIVANNLSKIYEVGAFYIESKSCIEKMSLIFSQYDVNGNAAQLGSGHLNDILFEHSKSEGGVNSFCYQHYLFIDNKSKLTFNSVPGNSELILSFYLLREQTK